MFSIYDGRTEFYQWDLDRAIVVSDPKITKVHFSTKASTTAYVAEVYEKDRVRLANVPNILLQNSYRIRVYGQCEDTYTKVSAMFEVIERAKPEDYIYTEQDRFVLEEIQNDILTLEETSKALDEKIESRTSAWYAKPMVELLAPTTINSELTPIKLPLIEGDSFVVTYNDKKYTCEVKTISPAEGVTMNYIGNVTILAELEPESFIEGMVDTGEPFLLIVGVGEGFGISKETATISVSSFIGNKVEILPKTSVQNSHIDFTSPILFKEGDYVCAKVDGAFYATPFVSEKDDITGDYLVAYFDISSIDTAMGITTNDGITCGFANNGYINGTTQTVEIFQASFGVDETEKLPEVYVPKPDAELSLTSERPVQNKVLAQIIAELKARLEALENN